MRSTDSVRVCGRLFGEEELTVIRGLIATRPPLNRTRIAERTCEALQWRRPDGRLKDMSCRVALLRLERMGLIKLPPPSNGNGNGRAYQLNNILTRPPADIECELRELGDLEFRQVSTRQDSRLWNEVIEEHHYLGYKPLPGAQIRYLLESDRGLIAALGFGASAWKVGPRDRWIGWTVAQREARLRFVVNNARFLILPWVRCRNLASWILARCSRRLPLDWDREYGYAPALLETFVDADRFAGTCYRASNWQYLGKTQGRGKLDRHREFALPVKRVFVYPLAADFREVLCR